MGVNMKQYVVIGYDISEWGLPKADFYEDYKDNGAKGKYNPLLASYWDKKEKEFSIVETSCYSNGKFIFGTVIDSARVDDGDSIKDFTARGLMAEIEKRKESLIAKAKELFPTVSEELITEDKIDGFSFVAYS